MDPHPSQLRSHLFTVLFMLVILASVSLIYYKYIVQKDFDIMAKIPCNPSSESCFVASCDAEGDPRCQGQSTVYYKVLYKKAYALPSFTCISGETTCRVLTCNDEAIAALETEDTCSSVTEENK